MAYTILASEVQSYSCDWSKPSGDKEDMIQLILILYRSLGVTLNHSVKISGKVPSVG